ncbi:Transposase-associated domain [Dillenia turbinata]|uniref:Transposase-associated domain n=1 Tax=Dillenia turbinata TaxID=194707 RepID=A0AAN8YZM9_9MAGN
MVCCVSEEFYFVFVKKDNHWTLFPDALRCMESLDLSLLVYSCSICCILLLDLLRTQKLIDVGCMSIEHLRITSKSFLKFGEDHIGDWNVIRCPCIKCLNVRIQSPIVQNHLLEDGIMFRYHGEYKKHEDDSDHEDDDYEIMMNVEEDDELLEMLQALLGENHTDNRFQEFVNDNQVAERKLEKSGKLLRECRDKSCPGCTMPKLSFLVELLHLKACERWGVESFNILVGLTTAALPVGEKYPKSYEEAKSKLRTEYLKIWATTLGTVQIVPNSNDDDARGASQTLQIRGKY